MHAQQLTTRVNLNGFQGDACLLVYDEQQLTGTMLSDDVREIFDSRPGVARIYLLAPFITESVLRELINSSAVFARMGSYFKAIGGRLCILGFCSHLGAMVACETPFFVDDDGKPKEERASVILDELRNGWLFDLFDKFRGRVDAPPGVHFAKSSRRHTAKFLRVSNILLSSSACALIAYFVLGTIKCGQPKRIFVDTAPLLGVAFALQRLAITHEIWTLHCPVTSFSSYGGLDRLPPSSGRDLILVSASTSGGLAGQLLSKEFDASFLATLFYLGCADTKPTPGTVICDLTFKPGRQFGYPPITSYSFPDCPLCAKGFFLAELEGDQFQLEKRAIKHLTIKKVSQTVDARETLEELARGNLIYAQPFYRRGQSTNIDLDADSMLRNVSKIRSRFIRALRRNLPMPLSYVVLVDISESLLRELVHDAQLDKCFDSAKFILYEALSGSEQLESGVGGALVVFGTLSNFSKAREINALLRIKVPKGCVSYLSGLTIANSAEHLSDLKMFLTYGEYGRDTFTYAAASTLMLPAKASGLTAWEAELTLLQQIADNGCSEKEITDRISTLLDQERRTNGLFWPGRQGDLQIQNDFVYLTVDKRKTISQADVFATIANLLATVRMDNRGLTAASQIGQVAIQWHQSVYGHAALDPASFEDYNDAILHASFLRAAAPTELNYSADKRSSERVLTVIRAQVQAWSSGGGDSLPEFLLALATSRLSLSHVDCQEIVKVARSGMLPQYLHYFIDAIEALT